jgi:hypothetical protein
MKDECKELSGVKKWGCFGIDRLYIYNKQAENDKCSLKYYQIISANLFSKAKSVLAQAFTSNFAMSLA